MSQNFASVATIRAAIFDLLDRGDQDGQPWVFNEIDRENFAGGRYSWTEDMVNVERINFVDAVVKRIAELQAPPHEGIKLENLCDQHKRRVLPAPTANVCVMCEAERKGPNRG